MSYYSDLDNDLGAAEEAEEHYREHEQEQRRKKKSFDAAVAAEVKRQIAKLVEQISPAIEGAKREQTVTFIRASVGTGKSCASRGKTMNVKCANCGHTFAARVADIKRGWGKHCSKRCKASKQEKETGQYARYLENQEW